MSTRFFTNRRDNTLLEKFAGVFANNPNILFFASDALPEQRCLPLKVDVNKAKRQHPAWCLMAFLSIIGIIVLGCLKDRGLTPPALPTGQGQNGGDADGLSRADEVTERFILPVGRSGWAIASGYLGLFSVLIVPAPFALLTGVLAIRAMRRDPKKRGMGRAVFGIVMGGLGTAILLVALAVYLFD